MSDWLGRLAAAAPPAEADGAAGWAASAPDWLALLGDGLDSDEAFREALPFGLPDPPMPEPAPEPLPEPPAADPAAAARAQAYAEGEAAGRAAAEAAGEARAGRQRALRLTFRALDETALAVLAEDLAATVLALCEGVIADVAIDADGVRARCRAAAQRIGGAAERLTLHLHPEDAALLGDDALPGWRLVADVALERGTVLIEGPEGSVSDGPAEWRRAIAAAVRG
jgi:flagellar assembly protein FliH